MQFARYPFLILYTGIKPSNTRTIPVNIKKGNVGSTCFTPANYGNSDRTKSPPGSTILVVLGTVIIVTVASFSITRQS